MPNPRVYSRIAGYSAWKEKFGYHHARPCSTGRVRVVWPVAWRGTQAVGVTCHHRLVLGLRDLVFA